jgi:hypothetical protein
MRESSKPCGVPSWSVLLLPPCTQARTGVLLHLRRNGIESLSSLRDVQQMLDIQTQRTAFLLHLRYMCFQIATSIQGERLDLTDFFFQFSYTQNMGKHAEEFFVLKNQRGALGA